MFRRPSSVPHFEYQPSATRPSRPSRVFQAPATAHPTSSATRPSRPYGDHEMSLYAFHCLLVAPTPHFSPSTLESLATSCLALPYSAWFPLSDCGCVGRQVNARRPWTELPSGQQGYAGKSARAPTDHGSHDSDDGLLWHLAEGRIIGIGHSVDDCIPAPGTR